MGENVEQQLVLSAELAAVRLLRKSLLQLCEQVPVDAEVAGDFALAVSEAFSNAVRHGCRATRVSVQARIEVTSEGARVTLHYPGEPFTLDEPRLPEPASTGGRGRYLMSVLADRVEYTFESGMTRAVLSKRWLQGR